MVEKYARIRPYICHPLFSPTVSLVSAFDSLLFGLLWVVPRFQSWGSLKIKFSVLVLQTKDRRATLGGAFFSVWFEKCTTKQDCFFLNYRIHYPSFPPSVA